MCPVGFQWVPLLAPHGPSRTRTCRSAAFCCPLSRQWAPEHPRQGKPLGRLAQEETRLWANRALSSHRQISHNCWGNPHAHLPSPKNPGYLLSQCPILPYLAPSFAGSWVTSHHPTPSRLWSYWGFPPLLPRTLDSPFPGSSPHSHPLRSWVTSLPDLRFLYQERTRAYTFVWPGRNLDFH